MRILLAEDDQVLADALGRVLARAAYAVDIASTGEQTDVALQATPYDLCILDLGLPGVPGLEVLRRLRARRSTTPVLILTAMDALADRVAGLDAGADDYVTKPFDLPELEARVRAQLRRGTASGSPLRAQTGRPSGSARTTMVRNLIIVNWRPPSPSQVDR